MERCFSPPGHLFSEHIYVKLKKNVIQRFMYYSQIRGRLLSSGVCGADRTKKMESGDNGGDYRV